MEIKKEIGRKLIHIVWFLVLLGYLAIERTSGKPTEILLPFGILVVVLILEYLRLELDFDIPVLGALVRKKEQNTLSAPTFTLIGVTIALAVFSREIAAASIAMMVFGDIAAWFVGSFGKIRMKNSKSLEGSIAELIVCIVVGYIFFPSWIVVVMAGAATITEAFTTKLEDNMLMVLAAGLAGQLLI